MSATSARRQRGAALLLLAAIIVLGVSWMLISALGNASQRTASSREHNARVLKEAKTALISWIADKALDNSDENPGRLPCPQAWGDVAGDMEGRAAANCAAPAAGWLPWRTLGVPKLYDAYGNQLWYIVSPGWHLPNSSTKLTINSNTVGQLSLDGQTVVALLIAPGPPLNIAPNANQVTAGCTARTQSRSQNPPTFTPNPLDYLDCHNGTTADSTFTSMVVDNGVNPVFNDQVLAVTAADVMPALEAAIAKRIELRIAPVLKAVYSTSTWGTNVSATNPLLPFAVPFVSPPTTSNYRGAAGTFAGLLPFNQTQGCDSGTDPRCTNPTTGPSGFLAFSKNGADSATTLIPPLPIGWIRTQSTCTWTGNNYVCTGEYQLAPIKVTFTLRVTNVAMGLRTFDPTKVTCTAIDDAGGGIGLQNIGCETVSMALQADGSALITVTTNFTPDIVTSGWGTYANYIITFDRAVFGDHSLLDANNATTGWFVRNEWYRLLHYATVSSQTAAVLPAGTPGCTTGTNCLTVTNLSPANNKRGLLVLAGRALNGQTRPNATATNYLEAGNATGAYIKKNVSPVGGFNDRFVVIIEN
jgi:hypothetical protein